MDVGSVLFFGTLKELHVIVRSLIILDGRIPLRTLLVVCSPYSRQVKESNLFCLLWRGFFMGEKRRTFDIGFKKKVVDLYLKGRLGCKAVEKEFGINHTTVLRWVRHYEAVGLKDLEEKRGKSEESNKEKLVSHSESSETKIKRLEAENEMLKKLLQM